MERAVGLGKKAFTHKGKKVVEGVTEDIPVVGDPVDDSIKSGPLDCTKDGLDDTKDKFDQDKKKGVLDR
jgi:hypothetical protein